MGRYSGCSELCFPRIERGHRFRSFSCSPEMEGRSFSRGFPLCVGLTGSLLLSGGSTGAFLFFGESSGLLCGGSTGSFLGSWESDLAAGFLESLHCSGVTTWWIHITTHRPHCFISVHTRKLPYMLNCQDVHQQQYTYCTFQYNNRSRCVCTLDLHRGRCLNKTVTAGDRQFAPRSSPPRWADRMID